MPRAESPRAVAEEQQQQGGGAVQGIVKSVKKMFKKDSSEQEAETDENKLSLTRTKTNEKALKLERTKSTSEPALGAPFPSIKVGAPTSVSVRGLTL